MTSRLANEEVTLAHGGNTVRLRPSLRAAVRLERLHDGFRALERRIFEFHLGTIREIITIAATDRQEAAAFLAYLDTAPLQVIAEAITLPIIGLCACLLPEPDGESKSALTSAKPVAWTDFYADQFEKATGWLAWTPEQAWNATPTEIQRAYNGLVDKLKAIHGSGDNKKDDKEPDPEQAARNVAEGLDPEFDRNALRAMKAKIAGGA